MWEIIRNNAIFAGVLPMLLAAACWGVLYLAHRKNRPVWAVGGAAVVVLAAGPAAGVGQAWSARWGFALAAGGVLAIGAAVATSLDGWRRWAAACGAAALAAAVFWPSFYPADPALARLWTLAVVATPLVTVVPLADKLRSPIDAAAALCPLVPAAMLVMFSGLEAAAVMLVAAATAAGTALALPPWPAAANRGLAAAGAVAVGAVVHAHLYRTAYDPALYDMLLGPPPEPDPYGYGPADAGHARPLGMWAATALTLLAPLGLWAGSVPKVGGKWARLAAVGGLSGAAAAAALAVTDLSVYLV